MIPSRARRRRSHEWNGGVVLMVISVVDPAEFIKLSYTLTICSLRGSRSKKWLTELLLESWCAQLYPIFRIWCDGRLKVQFSEKFRWSSSSTIVFQPTFHVFKVVIVILFESSGRLLQDGVFLRFKKVRNIKPQLVSFIDLPDKLSFNFIFFNFPNMQAVHDQSSVAEQIFCRAERARCQ
jgi:hypothetical protein